MIIQVKKSYFNLILTYGKVTPIREAIINSLATICLFSIDFFYITHMEFLNLIAISFIFYMVYQSTNDSFLIILYFISFNLKIKSLFWGLVVIMSVNFVFTY